MFFSNETSMAGNSDLPERLLAIDEKEDALPDLLDEKKSVAVVNAVSHPPNLLLSSPLNMPTDFSPSELAPEEETKIEITLTEREGQLKELQYCIRQLAAMQRYQRPAKLCQAAFVLLFVTSIATLIQSNAIAYKADEVYSRYNTTIIPETGTSCNQEYPDNSCAQLLNITRVCYDLFEQYCDKNAEMVSWLIATLIIFFGLFGFGTCCVFSLSILCMRDPTYLFTDLCEYTDWRNDEELDPIVFVAEQHNIRLYRKSLDEVYKAFLQREKELIKMLSPSSASLLGDLFHRCFRRRPTWKVQQRKAEHENPRIASIPLDTLNEAQEVKKFPVRTNQYQQRPRQSQMLSQPLLPQGTHLSMQIFRPAAGVNAQSYEEKTRKPEDKKIAAIDLDILNHPLRKFSFN